MPAQLLDRTATVTMGCVGSTPEKYSGDAKAKYVTSAVGGLHTSESDSDRSPTDKEAAKEAAAVANGTRDFSSWVEVRVAATRLKSADLLSKSDAMVALFSREKDGWKEVARTEVVGNNENPTWLKAFRILYNFEQVQQFRVEIVDVDRKHDADKVPFHQCNRLGHADFRLSEILTTPERRLTLNMQNTSTKSQVHLMAEELSSCRDVFTMQVSASGLKNVDLLSKSDPFLEINSQDTRGRWKPVFKTEVKMNNLSPAWNTFTLRGASLNGGDHFRPLMLRVYDYDASGKHTLLGEVEASTATLLSIAGSEPLQLVDVKFKGNGRKHAGVLHIKTMTVSQRPTFLDYVQAGAEINFICGIDFTASNKDPRDPESLHYLSQTGGNTPYEDVISGVAHVLQAYDKDNLFQCYGFGCKLPGSTVDHCVPLGPDGSPTVQGIQGIVQAYRNALYTRALSGPTLFGPLLKQAAATASTTSGFRYTVCLILTDGCIHDMQDTVDTIVSASSLPMSIIIVGIGNSPELEAMKVLDSDKRTLMDRHGVAARRDIVQYVNFTDYKNDAEALACELLAELPGQFLEYCKLNNMPLPNGAMPAMSSYQSISPYPSNALPQPITPSTPHAPPSIAMA